jgi:hypothetical protein
LVTIHVDPGLANAQFGNKAKRLDSDLAAANTKREWLDFTARQLKTGIDREHVIGKNCERFGRFGRGQTGACHPAAF